MQGPRHLPPDPRRLSLTVTLTGLMFLAAMWGCQTTHVVTADAEGAPQYEQLTIVYELRRPRVTTCSAEQIDLATAQARPLRAALATRREASVERVTEPDLRLTLRCPHPEGAPDEALATLEAFATATADWHPVATRSLSRTDVDLLLVHLANGGVCDLESRPHGTTRIGLEIDGHAIEKDWTREPRLDRLAVETYDARR